MAFGDVNLSEEPIRGSYNPGAGGWPTIRYFNTKTGYEGAPYTKKTEGAMCDELGKDEYMQAYVEEAGGTSLCKASDGAGCGEKELGFIAKYKDAGLASTKAQLERLQGMSGSAMKPDLQKWLGQRIAILKQLAAAAAAKEEL